MKSLTLFRHAKTERDSLTGRDIDRQLSERGEHDTIVNAPLRGTGRFGRKKTPNSKTATPAKNAVPVAEAAPKEKPAKKSVAAAKAPKKKAAAKNSAPKAKKSKAKA